MQTEERANTNAKGLFISLLRDGQPIYVNARGGSMYPFVKNGDVEEDTYNQYEI